MTYSLFQRNRGVLTVSLKTSERRRIQRFGNKQKGHRWKEDMKPSRYRRVVTMNVDGHSVVQSDEQMQAYEFKSVPNYEHTLVWVTPSTPDLREEQRFDRYPESVVPGPGGTSLHFVTFPPSSVFADPSFDGEAARREALIRLRAFRICLLRLLIDEAPAILHRPGFQESAVPNFTNASS